MRREYDFSKGVRGKFYRPDAQLLIPVYLEPKVQAFVAARAAKDGTGVSEVVNRILMHKIAAEPATGKKAATGRDTKGRAELLLLTSDARRIARSGSGAKLYAVRDARGRFKDVQAYRHNPIRKTTKALAHAAKKVAKRAKR